MRMPNSRQMSEEQRDIYDDAPLDGIILVTGPPGTGKTVIAFLRANTVSQMGMTATVAMYGSVLSSYTSNVASSKFAVKTLHQWIYHLWDSLNLKSEQVDIKVLNSGEKRIYLACPYEEKEKVKKLGARFDWQKRKWWILEERFKNNQFAFESWLGTRKELPKHPDDKWLHDWDGIFREIITAVMEGKLDEDEVNWGHFIIDEAQDFPDEMFAALKKIVEFVFSERDPEDRPSMTIFADENQRLNEKTNSSISMILSKINLEENRIYTLTKNYRNTKQIAKLSRTFYVGLVSGIPELPDREGEVPILFSGRDVNDSVKFIENYIRNHENQEIGVIASNDKMRKKMFNKLQYRFQSHPNISVQTYGSNDEENNNADDLNFDQVGVVTVLNKQSCKGLEFDAVFLPELQVVSIDPSDEDQFRMEMYVMTSRARDILVLMYSNEGEGQPAVLSYLPDHNSNLLEYYNG